MKHYKYSRKEIAKELQGYGSVERCIKRLLATISKEEYSQRLMMEQVPKDNIKLFKNNEEHMRLGHPDFKQDKSVKLSHFDAELIDKLIKIGVSLSVKEVFEWIKLFYKDKPIIDKGWKEPKDTNKTRLEVPKVFMDSNNQFTDEFICWVERITEKVISLQKEK